MSLTEAEKKRLASKLSSTSSIMSSGVVKLYLASPDPKANKKDPGDILSVFKNLSSSSWLYSNVWGALVFVVDRSLDTFVFQIYDLKSFELRFEVELYEDLLYSQLDAQFHAFEGDECLIGFSFSDEKDARRFFSKVKALKPSGRNVQQPTTLKKKKKGVLGTLFGTGKSTRKNVPAMQVSGVQSVTHNAHIGINADGTFDLKNISPEWKAIFKQAGIRKKDLRNPETAAEIINTIAESTGMEVPENFKNAIEQNKNAIAAKAAARQQSVPQEELKKYYTPEQLREYEEYQRQVEQYERELAEWEEEQRRLQEWEEEQERIRKEKGDSLPPAPEAPALFVEDEEEDTYDMDEPPPSFPTQSRKLTKARATSTELQSPRNNRKGSILNKNAPLSDSPAAIAVQRHKEKMQAKEKEGKETPQLPPRKGKGKEKEEEIVLAPEMDGNDADVEEDEDENEEVDVPPPPPPPEDDDEEEDRQEGEEEAPVDDTPKITEVVKKEKPVEEKKLEPPPNLPPPKTEEELANDLAKAEEEYQKTMERIAKEEQDDLQRQIEEMKARTKANAEKLRKFEEAKAKRKSIKKSAPPLPERLPEKPPLPPGLPPAPPKPPTPPKLPPLPAAKTKERKKSMGPSAVNLAEISKVKLKHADTVDKSVPDITGKRGRGATEKGLLGDIEKGAVQLKSVKDRPKLPELQKMEPSKQNELMSKLVETMNARRGALADEEEESDDEWSD